MRTSHLVLIATREHAKANYLTASFSLKLTTACDYVVSELKFLVFILYLLNEKKVQKLSVLVVASSLNKYLLITLNKKIAQKFKK